jgi:murein DD-endopeptidase MepM/ murein hydrolase activator NlpD
MKNEKGFSMVELTMAAAISVMLAGVAVATVSSASSSVSEKANDAAAIENCTIIEALIAGENGTGFCDSEWIIPFESPKILTSLYGFRTAPCDGICSTDHKGVDFAAPVGTPVLAAAAGVVVKSENTELCDFDIVVEHKEGEFRTRYLHLSQNAKVGIGDSVIQGQVLGYIGEPSSNACSTGPHLHFELQKKSLNFIFFAFYEAVNPIYGFWLNGVDLTQGGIITSDDKNHKDRVSEHCADIPQLYMCSA